MKDITPELSNRIYWGIVLGLIVWIIVYINQVYAVKDRWHKSANYDSCVLYELKAAEKAKLSVKDRDRLLLENCKAQAPIGTVSIVASDEDFFAIVSSEGGALIGWREDDTWLGGKKWITSRDGLRFREGRMVVWREKQPEREKQ